MVAGSPFAVPREHAGYYGIAGDHLYTVLHEVDEPLARVLLIGPMAQERNHTYLHWVLWARYLAARRIEVLRFDYRGVGESTGSLEHMTFSHWMEDVEQLYTWLRARSPEVPVLLHGLSLGALFAGRSFHAGLGDGLILWSPPANANVLLRSALISWVNLRGFLVRAEERQPFSHYIEQLELEGFLEVHGFRWSSALWHDSIDFDLPAALADGGSAAAAYAKPVMVTRLSGKAAPLVKGGVTGYEENNDLEWLYSSTYQWICSNALRQKTRTYGDEGQAAYASSADA